jgi:hypothetical protein
MLIRFILMLAAVYLVFTLCSLLLVIPFIGWILAPVAFIWLISLFVGDMITWNYNHK